MEFECSSNIDRNVPFWWFESSGINATAEKLSQKFTFLFKNGTSFCFGRVSTSIRNANINSSPLVVWINFYWLFIFARIGLQTLTLAGQLLELFPLDYFRISSKKEATFQFARPTSENHMSIWFACGFYWRHWLAFMRKRLFHKVNPIEANNRIIESKTKSHNHNNACSNDQRKVIHLQRGTVQCPFDIIWYGYDHSITWNNDRIKFYVTAENIASACAAIQLRSNFKDISRSQCDLNCFW